MANPVCAPYDDTPAFTEVTSGQKDQDVVDAFIADYQLEEVAQRQKAEVRQGIDNSDKANLKKIAAEVENMTGLSLQSLQRYFNDRISQIQKGNSTVKQRDIQQVVAALDVHWSRRGAGIKNLASSYLLQRGEGQTGIAQGIAFLQQMKAFSDLGLTLQKYNLDVGSALRQRKLSKNMTRAFDEMGIDPTQIQPEELMQAAQGQLDAFDEIARMMATDTNKALQMMDKLAKQFEMMDDPRMVAGVVSRWKRTWSTWDEVWINGLLSAPSTFVTNAAGAAWVGIRPLMQLGAASAYAALDLPGASTAKLAAAEAGAYLAAINSSFMDALHLGWQAAKTETSILQPTRQAITAANLGIAPEKEGLSQMINAIGGVVRLPSRGLLGTDEFAKVIALRGEAAAQGVRRAALEGVDPTDKTALEFYVNREVGRAFNVDAGSLRERYAYNPRDTMGNVDPDAKAYQYEAWTQSGDPKANAYMPEGMSGRSPEMRARKAVFQEDNSVADFISKARNTPVGGLIKPFIPFVRTPTNILKQGLVEGTGIGALWKGGQIAAQQGYNPGQTIRAIQKELLADPGDTFMIAGHIAFTTALAGTAWGMATGGMLTGGGPGQWATGAKAKKAQDAWIAAGNVPYSLKIGDTAIPLDRLGEPMTIFLKMVADAGMFSGYMNQMQQDVTFAQIVSIGAAGVFDASFLRGIDDLMRVFRSSGDMNNFDYELGRAAQNYVATQTPFGSLLAYLDRVNNPYKSAYEGATFTEMMNFAEIELGRGLFGKLVNKIPGVDTQPLLIDQITGQPVPIVPGTGPNGLNPLQQAIPFMPRNSSADEVWQAVMDINGSYTEKNFGSRLKLLPEEQQMFNTTMSSLVINGKTLQQAILAFRRRPDVELFVRKSGVVLNNAEIQKEFKKLIARYSEKTKVVMARNNPNLLERLLTVEARELAESRGEVDQVRQIDQQIEGLILRARRGY